MTIRKMRARARARKGKRDIDLNRSHSTRIRYNSFRLSAPVTVHENTIATTLDRYEIRLEEINRRDEKRKV